MQGGAVTMEEDETTTSQKDWLDKKIDEVCMRKRRIFLSSAVDSNSAKQVIRKLWYLDSLDSKAPIYLIINSPGGSIDAGFAIWDQIEMIDAPVYTLVTGLAASMGSILSLAAAPKKRFATPYARIMIHQPLIAGVVEGQATDLEIQAKEIIKTRELLVNIYIEKTKKDKKVIEKSLDRDTWMSAEEALSFGLLDKIVSSYKEIEAK